MTHRHPQATLQCGQCRKAIFGNTHETLQPVTDSGEPNVAAIRADAILDFKMAGLHPYFNSCAGERQNASSRNGRFAG